jgi:lipoyl(octanoyl) transferase
MLLDLGFVKDYKKVWDLQKELLTRRQTSEVPDTLILVEHDHVLTLGHSSHLENILLKDLPIYEIERGGDVTYHGPGQIVGYPIISLQERGMGVRQYIELLESVIVDSLSSIGLKGCEGKLGKETGVWTPKGKKIASIGVAVSHWITYHGFALNVNTDLEYFQKIKPCGFEADVMTSLSNELAVRTIEMNNVKQELVKSMSFKLGEKFLATEVAPNLHLA